MGLDAEEHAGQRASGEPGCTRSHGQAQDPNPTTLFHDELNHIPSIRSQRHMDADLAHSLSTQRNGSIRN